MKRLHGVGAAPGTAVAPAYVYRAGAYELPEGRVPDGEKPFAELCSALDGIAADFEDAAREAIGAARDILRAQATMARDPALRAAAEAAVRAGKHPARAILRAGERFARELEDTRNDYLAARAPDVRHICDLAARQLAGAPPRLPPHPVAPCVLIAEDLTPADTTTLDPSIVLGIATAGGSSTSHTSVVARGLGIPAVVGVAGLLERVRPSKRIAIDGGSGEVFVEPDGRTVATLNAAGAAEKERRARIRAAAGTGPGATADGRRVELAANVRSVEEIRAALAEGAEGVGLLRTELLYVDRDRPPSEQEQVTLLGEMHNLLAGRRLVVRTFDIGADKAVPFLPARPERNPELGVRGLRLARVHQDLLDTQLRAIAATSVLGATAVMAPMVATAGEAEWFVERALANGMPGWVELGVMVEVPSLVFSIAELPPQIAFLSIGTNDLTQYLHAADRRNAELASLHDPFLPAVLRAVDMICRASGDRRVAVCGEAASDPAWALIAVGLGVTELSMRATAIAEVRAALRRVTFERCRDAAERCLRERDAVAARALAAELMGEEP